MNLQKKNSLILKICLVNTLWPSIKAFPVKIYECPLTDKTLVEQILSVSSEDLNKPITNDTKLEMSKKYKYQSTLQDSPEFEIYKSAITVIREKVFKQLDTTENASPSIVIKLKNSLINLNNQNAATPKTFSYGKLSLDNSEMKSFELYSISGEFQIINTPGDNKIFASYDESGNQKLNYFAPPEKDYEAKILKDINNKKNKIDEIKNQIKKFDELGKKNPNKIEEFQKKSEIASKDINKLQKEIDDLNLYTNKNVIKNEIKKTHGKTVSPDNPGRIRDSDSEVLILEHILKLTEPNHTTQAYNIFYSTLYESLHDYWNLDRKFPKEIVNIKSFRTLNINDLNQNAVGTLKLYTSYETCPSCKNAYILFSTLRPNIKLEITTVSDEIRNYLYTSDFTKTN